MNYTNPIINLVRQLIKAENDKDKDKKAESLLSREFIAITRASGKEESKNKMLETIAKGNPNYPDMDRKLEEYEVVGETGDLVVVRSIVTTTNPTGRYRNIHVFVKEDEQMRCKVWQVTKLEN